MTDVMMGSLITSGLGRVVVDFPDEPTTGADMEWNFVNPDDNTFFRVLLQAKQAYGHGANWKRHSYRELLHTVGASKKRQTDILTHTARNSSTPTYPLYVFYNPLHTCTLARATGASQVIGVTLADGYLVSFLSNRLHGRHRNSLETLHPLFFHLADLFCPPSIYRLGPFAYVHGSSRAPLLLTDDGTPRGIGIPVPPDPYVVRERLVELRSPLELPEDDFPEVPEVGKTIPDEIQSILFRHRHRTPPISPEGLDRWRITFISMSSDGESPRDFQIGTK